jgi:hypothetical protein
MTGTGSDHYVTPLFLTGASWALPETGSSANKRRLVRVCLQPPAGYRLSLLGNPASDWEISVMRDLLSRGRRSDPIDRVRPLRQESLFAGGLGELVNQVR